jgi:hypothetical protein
MKNMIQTAVSTLVFASLSLCTNAQAFAAVAQPAKMPHQKTSQKISIMTEEIRSLIGKDDLQFRSSQIQEMRQMATVGTLLISGTQSPLQVGSAKIVRCHPTADSSGIQTMTRESCDTKFYIPLNQATTLEPGFYLLGYENTIYPGFIEIHTGEMTKVDLVQIPLPQTLPNASVRVYLNLQKVDEQMKFYFTTYGMGESFFLETSYDFGDIGVSRWPYSPNVPVMKFDVCKQRPLPKLTPKTTRLCQAYKLGGFMGMMEFFDFRDLAATKTRKGYHTYIMREWQVSYPGNAYSYDVGRVLVATPGKNTPGAFVNVLPGAYRAEVSDGKQVAAVDLGTVGPKTADGQLVTFYGVLVSASQLAMQGQATESQDNSSAAAGGDVEEVDMGLASGQTCKSSKIWRTEFRAWCASDADEGCNRRAAKLCEPMYDGGK